MMITPLLLLASAAGSGAVQHTLGIVADDALETVVVFDADQDVVRGRIALPVAGATVGDCALSADGLGFVTDGQGRVWVLDLSGFAARLDGFVAVSCAGTDLALTPDGRFLLVCGGAGLASVVDVAARVEVDAYSCLLCPPLERAIAAGPAGTVLLLRESEPPFEDALVTRLALSPLGILSDTGESWAPHTSGGNLESAPGGALALAIAGRRLTSLGTTGLVELDADGSLLSDGFAGAFAPAGDVFFVRERGGAADLLQAYGIDPDSGAFAPFALWEAQTCKTSAPDGMDSIAVHPDGSRLYVSGGPALCVYSTADGSLLHTLTDPALVDATGVALGPRSARRRAAPHLPPGGSVTRGL